MTVEVPNAELYLSASYCSPSRFAFYAHQIAETLRASPQSVLEIGPGNGVVSYVLRRAGLAVETVDVDGGVHPSVVGSVESLPFMPASFDLVLCCEVLEHIPYDRFPIALREIRRVARRHAVISLPNAGRYCYLEVVLPGLGRRRLYVSLPWPKARRVDVRHHYWEVGLRGYGVAQVAAEMKKAGFEIRCAYRALESPYHMMFVLETR